MMFLLAVPQTTDTCLSRRSPRKDVPVAELNREAHHYHNKQFSRPNRALDKNNQKKLEPTTSSNREPHRMQKVYLYL
jgi:redox-sensitive bicupin YhaK (pirin superfamily)